jgi:hypothetical protein
MAYALVFHIRISRFPVFRPFPNAPSFRIMPQKTPVYKAFPPFPFPDSRLQCPENELSPGRPFIP